MYLALSLWSSLPVRYSDGDAESGVSPQFVRCLGLPAADALGMSSAASDSGQPAPGPASGALAVAPSRCTNCPLIVDMVAGGLEPPGTEQALASLALHFPVGTRLFDPRLSDSAKRPRQVVPGFLQNILFSTTRMPQPREGARAEGAG